MSHESLSALLDGECSAGELDRLLEEMASSPALKQQWSRLCLTREALADTRVRRSQPCLCSAVMAHLDSVPEAVVNPKVVELSLRHAPRRWHSLAGLAAAASVAAVALLVSFNASTPVTGQNETPAAVAVNSATNPSRASPDFTRTVALKDDGEQHWVSAGDDLDNYLMEHSSSVAGEGMGMGGTLRYARFAAHSAAYHPEGEP
ncbi:MAG: sigma-E factor negative regulatory protein [Stenotrophobium sp.]